MNPGIRILPLPSANGFSEGGWASRGQGNSLSLGLQTILEGEWITGWHEYVERKREYYHIIIFPEVRFLKLKTIKSLTPF